MNEVLLFKLRRHLYKESMHSHSWLFLNSTYTSREEGITTITLIGIDERNAYSWKDSENVKYEIKMMVIRSIKWV